MACRSLYDRTPPGSVGAYRPATMVVFVVVAGRLRSYLFRRVPRISSRIRNPDQPPVITEARARHFVCPRCRSISAGVAEVFRADEKCRVVFMSHG